MLLFFARLSLATSLLVASCVGSQPLVEPRSAAAPAEAPCYPIRLALFDAARNRAVPVVLYAADSTAGLRRGRPRPKVALLSHGYGGKNTAYTFVARTLVAQGYVVASIQHEQPGDGPMATEGNLRVLRRPAWERGVHNMRFVLRELRRRRPRLNYDHLLLVGHSNGGDMSALYAELYPAKVDKLITLDHRRMPLPRTPRPLVLTLRSSDQVADEGVLPSAAERAIAGTRIVPLPDTRHNDMWDGATEAQQREMSEAIARFVRE